MQTLVANTGKIWVGSAGMVKASGVGVYGFIPIPTANAQAGLSVEIALAPAGFNLAEIYLDSDVNGEAAIVSYTEQ